MCGHYIAGGQRPPLHLRRTQKLLVTRRASSLASPGPFAEYVANTNVGGKYRNVWALISRGGQRPPHTLPGTQSENCVWYKPVRGELRSPRLPFAGIT